MRVRYRLEDHCGDGLDILETDTHACLPRQGYRAVIPVDSHMEDRVLAGLNIDLTETHALLMEGYEFRVEDVIFYPATDSALVLIR